MATSDLDAAYEAAKAIVEQVSGDQIGVHSEEDTKLKIITRLLTEALGWSFADIQAEKKHENGFSDYLITAAGKSALLVEAKRIGTLQVGTAEPGRPKEFKLSGPALKKCMEGIDQAAGYAAPNGLPVAVLTDGSAWIVFKPFVAGEPFKSKEAIVFPSLAAVLSGFQLFFDLLSKEGVGKKLYNPIFDRIHQPRLMVSRELRSAIPEHEVRIIRKSEVAYDLDRVFGTFFSRLTGDEDEDMLIECFVETRESRFADFSLEKITASVLGNLSPIDRDVNSELSSLIEHVATMDPDRSEAGETVFIVGPTGAGKTTFLHRFFNKTLSDALRQKCVVVRVNCLDATGRPESVLTWLTEQLKTAFESKLYSDGIPTYEELQGLYHSEYLRRAKGADAQLYARDKSAFKEKFGQYLSDVVDADREGYLRRILVDVVKNRKLLPIIVFDNTDEFTLEFKTQIFQFAQSLRRHAQHCLLFFPITDKSAWAFSKTDIFGVYRSKSFFLPTPPPKEVFRRRIEFLRRRLSESEADAATATQGTYFSSRGIRISISDLSAFARILEEVFVEQEHTANTIGELTNYNIRRTLELSRRVITSSVFQIEDLLKSYVTGAALAPSYYAFMNALLKGDMDIYKRGAGSEVFPVFDVSTEVVQSPLLALRVLALLQSVSLAGSTIDQRHLSVPSIQNYFDALGCHETAIDRSLLGLLEAGLIEPYDSSVRDLSVDQRLGITPCGEIHLRLGRYNTALWEQLALTTPLPNPEIAAAIRGEYRAKGAERDRLEAARRTFLDYVLSEDASLISRDVDGDQYENQRSLLEDIGRGATDGRRDAGASNEGKPTTFAAVVATVDYYDPVRGFGFVDAAEVQDRIFLHADKIRDAEFERVSDGDDILCDIALMRRGWAVTAVHDIETEPDRVEIADATIVRLFPDRGYGFVAIGDGTRDAFFHYSVIPAEQRDALVLGERMRVEVVADRQERGLQVKAVIE